MAMPTRTPPATRGEARPGAAWPASRTLAAGGGVLSLAVAMLLLGGALAGLGIEDRSVPWLAGVSVLSAMGVVHLALAVLVLLSAWGLPGNPRVHGALLVIWGIAGLFVGLGLWVGALLAIVGGLLGLARAPGEWGGGRRPAL